jgi:hypothetical protein
MDAPGSTPRVPFISHRRFRDDLIIESRMSPFDAAGVVAWSTEFTTTATVSDTRR